MTAEPLVLVGKPGCHLCEEMLAVVTPVAAEMGLELEEVSTGGASEAAFAAALGVPTLDGLGADGDGAHAEDEHVLIPSLPERAALAAGLIARLATEAPPAP